MNIREEKGKAIAITANISKGTGGIWKVPSQSGNGEIYEVDFIQQKCTCPDFETRQVVCKHLFAIRYSIMREVDPKTRIVKQTEKIERVSYSQDWGAYDAAQTTEKAQFISLLSDLCAQIPQPEQKTGRPRLPIGNMIFSMCYKVYSGFSYRRFSSDLREAHHNSIIAKMPSYSSVANYLDDPNSTEILKRLITISSLPLKAVESQFAVDSTGFGTSRFVRWYSKKYGKETDVREWIKLHITAGTNTHVITAVEISGWNAADTNYFKPLIESTAKHFQIAEVSADKAYLSHANFDAIANVGAQAFIPFKSTSVTPKGESRWAKAYFYYMLNRESYLQHYHRRSNVETCFSMIKSKFGDSIRSECDTAQIDEVLCKVLCHNICVVIQSMHELGITPDFSTGMKDVQNATGY